MDPLGRWGMTGHFWLDWSIQVVSLFNVIVLTWLGLAVLFNAQRRTGGILLAGGGLLMGGAFFISHTALIGIGANIITAGQDFWWFSGWALAICLPFAWYLVILWYTGFWETRTAGKSQSRPPDARQRIGFAFCLLFLGLLVAAIFITHGLPRFTLLAQSRTGGPFSIRGIFPLSVLYPVYALLCMGLSIDALRRPAPSRRWLGDLARRRAQPWLLAASLLLLTVSLLVGAALNWILLRLERGVFPIDLVSAVGVFDLVIASLISLSVLLIGQAVVSYEIFTARTLPRNGLIQHWRRAILLGAGYSLLVAWTLAIQLRPIYSLLLATVIMTVFLAMLAWRSYAERERFMDSLRPFLAAPKVYNRILDRQRDEASVDISNAFRSLCEDVLETRRAYLAPGGMMASLAGSAIHFPDADTTPISITGLMSEFQPPNENGLPLDPHAYQGFIWAIPLWSERGLMGVFLLGEKRLGGLYSQEEVEMARLTGERLIDLKASVELARRLAILERQHLTQNQVLDQQARRVLHDEILPLVHTVLLKLASNPDQNTKESIALLAEAHHQISDLLRSMTATLSPDVKRLGVLGALRQVVERDLAGVVKACDWQVEAPAETLLKDLPALESEVLFFAAREALRNAARYGRTEPDRPTDVTIRVSGEDGLRMVIENQGEMVDPAADISPPPNLSSSGQGIALHSALMAVIGGALSIEHNAGSYTRVILSLPDARVTAARQSPAPS